MNLEWSETQGLLREALREMLAREVPFARVRRVEKDRTTDAELWRRLNDRILEPDPAARGEAACARLRAQPELADLPARFSLFGLTRLPAGQLQVLRAVLERRLRGGEPARVLCAGCSSGEEPYSIAILACEWFGPVHRVQVIGVDASERSLARARAGRYSRWSLRETPAQIRSRYFEPDGKGAQLRADVRRAARFEQQNLADPKAPIWKDGGLVDPSALHEGDRLVARGIVENHTIRADRVQLLAEGRLGRGAAVPLRLTYRGPAGWRRLIGEAADGSRYSVLLPRRPQALYFQRNGSLVEPSSLQPGETIEVQGIVRGETIEASRVTIR